MYGSHDVDSADGLSRASLNARNFLAGGVNSPIPTPSEYPKYVVSGEGPYILDNAGNRYIDLWMGYGALLRGHRDPVVEAAIGEVLHDGWFFSLPRVDEIELSAVLHDLIPCPLRNDGLGCGSLCGARCPGLHGTAPYSSDSRWLPRGTFG